MSRSIKVLVLGVALVSVGGPAVACYDDEQSGSYEQQEYASNGGGLAGFTNVDESGVKLPAPLDLLMGFGVVVTAGSVGLLARRAKTRG